MASQQVDAGKLKPTGMNLTDLALKVKNKMNKLDENIQKVLSVWSGEASVSYLGRYQTDKASLAQLTQALQQMGAILGEFSDNYAKADSKVMDLVYKYLGKQEGKKMADASIKANPKQLKDYSNSIKTDYKNIYSYLSKSRTAVKNLKST